MFQHVRVALFTLVCLILLAAGDSVRAQSEIKGQRVFSAGHSFHYFMPPILADIAKQAEVDDHTQIGQSSIGGSRVYQHWNVAEEKNSRTCSTCASWCE